MDTASDPTPPEPSPWRYPSLGAAHAAAIGKIGTVSETGTNTFHRYSYATAADLSRAIRPVLAECDLSLTQIRVESTREKGPDTKQGKPQWLTHVLVTYRLLHASGEFVDLQAAGCGIDGEDKGVYKALTGAFKYMLRTSFCVVVGEDPEDDRSPEQKQQDAYEEGRRSAIRALANSAKDPAYSGPRFAVQLREAGLSSVELVRQFCVWVGLPKPSTMNEAERGKIIARLKHPKGAERFEQFLADTGQTTPDPTAQA